MNRIVLITALLYLVYNVPIHAQEASTRGEKELIKLENEWAEARVKRDIPFLEKFYAKEFRVNNMNGGEHSREFDIQMFASGDLKPEVITNRDVKASQYGDVGVVTGIEKVKGTYRGNAGEFTMRFTSIYVRRKGRWQMVLHQGTEIRKP